jgi:mannitol/fructose-specific phosphotransferase system IIA component (Ntr-type)
MDSEFNSRVILDSERPSLFVPTIFHGNLTCQIGRSITLFYDAGQDCLSGLAACNFGLFSPCHDPLQQAATPGQCTFESAIVQINCPKSAIITPACDREPHGAIVVEFSDAIRREAGSIGFDVVALPDAAAKSVEAALRFLIDHLVSTGRLQLRIAPAALNAVLDREQLGSTGVGNSVAMPQAALPNLTKDVIGVVANSATGISWEAADGVQVRWIVLCLTRSGLNADRLQTLQSLFAAIRQNGE